VLGELGVSAVVSVRETNVAPMPLAPPPFVAEVDLGPPPSSPPPRALVGAELERALEALRAKEP
jgi:hypothetical protein